MNDLYYKLRSIVDYNAGDYYVIENERLYLCDTSTGVYDIIHEIKTDLFKGDIRNIMFHMYSPGVHMVELIKIDINTKQYFSADSIKISDKLYHRIFNCKNILNEYR
jgi:hypothetical protein